MNLNQEQVARLRIGLIGAGRVGAPLSAALARAGHHVVGVSAISKASRERVELLLPEAPLLPPDEVATSCDLLILTPPDDALAQLAKGLAEVGSLRTGQLVMHTAGRFGVGVFDAILETGILPMAIHPVMTFTGTSIDLSRIAGAFFGVTTPEPLLPIAQALVLEMGGEPLVIAEKDRPLYHLALSWSTNFITAVIAQGSEWLNQIGIDQSERLLHPLLDAAVDNVLRRGDSALTGPIARGDVGSVRSHLDALHDRAPELVVSYKTLGRLTATRALEHGLITPLQATTLLEVLSDRS